MPANLGQSRRNAINFSRNLRTAKFRNCSSLLDNKLNELASYLIELNGFFTIQTFG
jgi:hypothetical protein